MLSHIIRSVALVALLAALLATPVPTAGQEGWDERTKQSVSERLARAEAARRAARNTAVPSGHRVAALLQLLQAEVADPVPDNRASLPAYTYAEQIHCQLISALRETGDFAAIATALAAVSQDSPVAKRLAIAAGFTIKPGADAMVTRLVCQLLSNLILDDPDDFIRSKAAEALGDAACAYPALRAEAAKVLAAALHDPAYRMVRHHSGLPYPQRQNYVYLDARGSLVRLGFEVMGYQVRDKATGAVVAAASATPAGSASNRLAARDVLAGNGYKVAWNAEKQELTAARGARLILLRAGSDTAVVDGREQKMDGPATLVGGRLQIPGNFMAPASP